MFKTILKLQHFHVQTTIKTTAHLRLHKIQLKYIKIFVEL